MGKKTYLEFGSLINNKKRKYENIKGELYDIYMLSRYFRDIYYLSSLKNKKNFKSLSKKLHHITDLKFNFVNFSLIKTSNPTSFYEFGQTLFEKIYFMKFISKFLNEKSNLKINWYGNDVSKIFNFFCENFFLDRKVKVFEKPNYKCLKNSVFYAKGVSLLYYKNNIQFLKQAINTAKCGSFDFSIARKKTTVLLNTGYKVYYPSIKSFNNILNNIKNKKIMIRNVKKNKNRIYFEVVFGSKKVIKKFLDYFSKKRQKYKRNKFIIKTFDLNSTFYDIYIFRKN